MTQYPFPTAIKVLPYVTSLYLTNITIAPCDMRGRGKKVDSLALAFRVTSTGKIEVYRYYMDGDITRIRVGTFKDSIVINDLLESLKGE